jgi:multisubunit Na+/H+ antiporter MnhC subunit
MWMRIFVALIILIAVAVGIFALVLPRDQLVRLIIFRDFFDVTLPILAFGALIKYLCTCSHHHHHLHSKDH